MKWSIVPTVRQYVPTPKNALNVPNFALNRFSNNSVFQQLHVSDLENCSCNISFQLRNINLMIDDLHGHVSSQDKGSGTQAITPRAYFH